MSEHRSAQSGSDVDLVAHSSSWTWLLDVRRRLNLMIELVDQKLTPLLPAGERGELESGRPLVDLDHALIQSATRRCLQSLKQEIVTVDNVKIACTPLVGARGRAVGALLVADQNADYGARDRRQLSRIGWWLAGALTVTPTSSRAADASELHRLASLHRLLSRASARTSERELVRVFIEALAVWQDSESWGFVADVNGRYTLEVMLPGSDRALVPPTVESFVLPSMGPVTRLSAADRARLGFQGPYTNLLLAQVRGHATSDWLIATTAEADAHSEHRLAVYLGVLGEALGEVSAVESSRLTWAMVQHLLPSSDSLEHAAATAIDDVSSALDRTVSFAVRRIDGQWALTVGEAARLLFSPGSGGSDDLLVRAVDTAPPYTAAVGIRRGGRPLTRRDDTLLQAAAYTLSAWLESASGRLAAAPERRKTPRSFDAVAEEQASGTGARAQDVSMIVLTPGAGVRVPDAAVAWIGRIRGQLRPTDLAGRLTSGDIGIVLPDTSPDGADVVLARIRQLVDTADETLSGASLGMATRLAGSPSHESLVAQARLRAAASRRPFDHSSSC